MSIHTAPGRVLSAVAAGLLVSSLAACGGDSGDGGGGGSGGGSSSGGGETLVFGASQDPVTLDGAYVSDGESIRAIRQVFEGLVTTKAGGTEVEPALAEKWETSPDGLQWTFNLKKGVKFHDGEPFDAKAVCTNFDRWYNFKGLQQSASVSYYWSTVFGGFAKNEDPELPPSLYKSCEAKDDATVVITLTKPSSTFITALTLPAFAFGSPKALQEFGADKVSGTGDAPKFEGTYGNEHATGTGPFKFKSWTRGDKLTLERNDDYWGGKAKIKTLIFRPIADGPSRRQGLQTGEIDGYDLVDPADVEQLKSDGFQILSRPAFNVGYLGFNQAKPPLDNLKIRQAIAHAINRENLLKTKYPAGAVVAKEFQPPEVFGYADDVTEYAYDPEKAKSLIKESGVANPTLEFWYPSDVSRPYMPDPAANFSLMKADLEAAGFKVTPKTAPWRPDYLNSVQNGKAPMYLIGWTGDFGDPDNFVGTFFQQQLPEWGFDDAKLRGALDDAEKETDEAKRTELYKAINKQIMDLLPGLPYVHTEPNIAFRKGISGYVPSPVNNEDFNTVTVTKK